MQATLSELDALVNTNGTTAARLVWRELAARSGRHPDLWVSNEQLAKWTGCAVRTVQEALRRLEALGVLEVIRDYALRIRRRIRLALEAVPGPAPAARTRTHKRASTRSFCADLGAESAHTYASPLHPPLKEVKPDNRIDDDSTGPPAEAADGPGLESGTVASSSVFNSWHEALGQVPEEYRQDDEGRRKASPLERRMVERKAADVMGDHPLTTAKVHALARLSSWDHVGQALEAAEKFNRRHRQDGKRAGWGYVARTLWTWRNEGGAPRPPSIWPPVVQFLAAADRRRFVAMLEREQQADPTFAELRDMVRAEREALAFLELPEWAQ